jgi:hypothetical protein
LDEEVPVEEAVEASVTLTVSLEMIKLESNQLTRRTEAGPIIGEPSKTKSKPKTIRLIFQQI